jgi:hypothetical protein
MPQANFASFSPHLFWDVDINSLSWEDNLHFIVHRVLDYGLFSDWQLLLKSTGLEKISSAAAQLRDLDDRSLWFISALSHIPADQFRCYTQRQSTPPHWNF